MTFNPGKFYLGVNIGWLNEAYGHDLSDAFFIDGWGPVPSTNTEFENIIDAYLMHLSIRSISVVRIWLFERLEGLILNNLIQSPMTFSPSNTFDYVNQPSFISLKDRIGQIMIKAHHYKLQIYWCLLDAALLLPGNNPPLWYAPILTHLVDTERNSFKENVLRPFLSILNTPGFADDVFAIDIWNEVDWAWNGGGLLKANVISFTQEIAEFIKANSSFRCTASFGRQSELQKMLKEDKSSFKNMDFFDYHRYLDLPAAAGGDNGTLPPWSGSLPCVIGEANYHYNPGVPRNETSEVTSCQKLMEQALANNYSGILLWRYTSVGSEHRFLKSTAPGTGSSALSTFLTNFLAARTAGGSNPFAPFEIKPIWDAVQDSVSDITKAGKTP